jgi:hypothetical protein
LQVNILQGILGVWWRERTNPQERNTTTEEKTLMQTFRMIIDKMINEQRVSMGEKKQGQNSNRKINGG